MFENKTPEFPIVQLLASKTINGSTANDTFEFELTNEDRETVEIIQNDRGKILFSPLDIEKEETYIYYIKEVLGNKNYKYDEHEYKVTVVISFNTDHYDVEVTYSIEDVEVEKMTFKNIRSDDKKEYKIPKTGVNDSIQE